MAKVSPGDKVQVVYKKRHEGGRMIGTVLSADIDESNPTAARMQLRAYQCRNPHHFNEMELLVVYHCWGNRDHEIASGDSYPGASAVIITPRCILPLPPKPVRIGRTRSLMQEWFKAQLERDGIYYWVEGLDVYTDEVDEQKAWEILNTKYDLPYDWEGFRKR